MKADNRKNLSNQQAGVTVWWFVAELTGAVLVVVDSVALHFHLVHLRKSWSCHLQVTNRLYSRLEAYLFFNNF